MKTSKELNAEIATRLKEEGFIQAGRGKSAYFKIIESDNLDELRELKISFSTTKKMTTFECIEERGLHDLNISTATVYSVDSALAFFNLDAASRFHISVNIPNQDDDRRFTVFDGSRKGLLIVGKQGSGKSTYARKIRAELGDVKSEKILHVNSDGMDPLEAVKTAEKAIQTRFGPDYVILELMSHNKHLVDAALWDIKNLDEPTPPNDGSTNKGGDDEAMEQHRAALESAGYESVRDDVYSKDVRNAEIIMMVFPHVIQWMVNERPMGAIRTYAEGESPDVHTAIKDAEQAACGLTDFEERPSHLEPEITKEQNVNKFDHFERVVDIVNGVFSFVAVALLIGMIVSAVGAAVSFADDFNLVQFAIVTALTSFGCLIIRDLLKIVNKGWAAYNHKVIR